MAEGHFYARLHDAALRSGTPRSVYSQDTTLSRRGLLTRADRRARELTGMGIGRRDLVALSMGNVAEFLILLVALAKLDAIAMPVDPANGDRMLLDATRRLPIRAVIRRPRGLETTALDYPGGYTVRSRKRLASSLLTVDVLEPPAEQAAIAIAPDVELVMEARGIGGVVRDTLRTAAHLREIGRAAMTTLELDAGAKILCAQPFTVPRFFDPVVLGWLESEAQLVMAEGPALDTVVPIARTTENLIVVDSVRQLIELARSVRTAGANLPIVPVIPQSTVPIENGRVIKQAFGTSLRQLLLLEEVGVLASRVMERGEHFVASTGVELCAGAAMKAGGNEVMVRSLQHAATLPPVPAGQPGALADDGWIHTGYAGRFKAGELHEIVGRDDGLVNLDGRRACLDSIEEAMLEHRRLTWVRATLVHASDGDPQVQLEYEATGETDVDDIQEHAVGHLAPFMVPRSFQRRT
ncbi:MAG: AMP-binding protein [Deltaproteobacteria bacterium]|nr:AMP-binding protein [Nannocystaceae bacterium]